MEMRTMNDMWPDTETLDVPSPFAVTFCRLGVPFCSMRVEASSDLEAQFVARQIATKEGLRGLVLLSVKSRTEPRPIHPSGHVAKCKNCGARPDVGRYCAACWPSFRHLYECNHTGCLVMLTQPKGNGPGCNRSGYCGVHSTIDIGHRNSPRATRVFSKRAM